MLGDVIDFYNKALADLPDHARLKGLQAAGRERRARPQGRALPEVFEADQRRIWVPLSEIPGTCRRRSWRRRTSASTSTTASTSAA